MLLSEVVEEEVLRVLPRARTARERGIPLVRLQVLQLVRVLLERVLAAEDGALEGPLVGVRPQVVEEIVPFSKDFIAKLLLSGAATFHVSLFGFGRPFLFILRGSTLAADEDAQDSERRVALVLHLEEIPGRRHLVLALQLCEVDVVTSLNLQLERDGEVHFLPDDLGDPLRLSFLPLSGGSKAAALSLLLLPWIHRDFLLIIL